MKTIIGYFLDAVEQTPDRVLFERLGGPSITYREAAGVIAVGLEKFKRERLVPGDRIIVLTDDTAALGLAILLGGFAQLLVLPISPIFSDSHINMLVSQCGARAIVAPPHLIHRASQFGVTVMFSCDEWLNSRWAPSDASKSGVHTLMPSFDTPKLFEHGSRLAPIDGLEVGHAISLDASFIIQPTSGSTGVPKLVLRGHRAFSRYAKYIGDEAMHYVPMSPRILAINALTHAFAGHMFTMALRLRATLLIPSALDFSCPIADVRMLDPDVLPMTPRVLASLLAQARAANHEDRIFAKRAKLLLSAGGGLAPSVISTMKETGVDILEFYGSSEASLISYSRHGAYRAGTAGRPAPDVELRRTAKGELLVRSPGLMAGYYGDSEMTDLSYTEDGFLRTGDMGEIAEDGYLRVLGRRREVFSTPEGTNIFPERLEIRLESAPSFDQVLLAGDGKPYLTAHIVQREAVPTDDPQGFLDPEGHREAYDQAALVLEEFCRAHETIEGIVAFCLYARRFPLEVYRPVTAGKFSKDRVAFGRIYEARIASLYGPLPRDSAHFVPPGERRFTRRIERLDRPPTANR